MPGFGPAGGVGGGEVFADQGEVGVVGGVVGQEVGPAGHNGVDLVLEALLFLGRVFDAAGGGLVVVQLGEGGPDVAVAGGEELTAEVHVVEGDGEFFGVESTDLEKAVFAHEEAGAGEAL